MIDKLRTPIKVEEIGENLNADEQVRAREAILAKDQKQLTSVDEFTAEMVKALDVSKEIDKAYEESGYREQFQKIEYCEREEDPVLKKMYEEEQVRFGSLSERMHGKVDGELDMDLHGNITFRAPGVKAGSAEAKAGIDEAGTYILRDGKLVKGKAELREQASYSNWYCANADPEDIRKHREMMDRMHYRGPKWEG